MSGTGSDRPSTTAQISARMSRQARRDTRPELAIRRELHRRGFRFRVDWPLPGLPRRRADIAFTRAKVVVFVDGCFWHACPEHSTEARTNANWWAEKLAGNVRRDRETDRILRSAGWTVCRVWEHQDVAESADLVAAAITSAVPPAANG